MSWGWLQPPLSQLRLRLTPPPRRDLVLRTNPIVSSGGRVHLLWCGSPPHRELRICCSTSGGLGGACSAWRLLSLLAGRPDHGCACVFTITQPPPPLEGRVLPGGCRPGPLPACMLGWGGFRPDAPRELRSFRLLQLVDTCAPSHPRPAGDLVGRPSRRVFDSSAPTELCSPFQLPGLAGFLAAPVLVTRICATLQIRTRSGLRPMSHPLPSLIPRSRPPLCPICPSAAPLLTRPATPVPLRRWAWLPFV